MFSWKRFWQGLLVLAIIGLLVAIKNTPTRQSTTADSPSSSTDLSTPDGLSSTDTSSSSPAPTDTGVPTQNASSGSTAVPAGVASQLRPFLVAYLTQKPDDTPLKREARIKQAMTPASFQSATDPKKNGQLLDFSIEDGIITITPGDVLANISTYTDSSGNVQVSTAVNLTVTPGTDGSASQTLLYSTFTSWKPVNGSYVLVGVTVAQRSQ